MPPLLLFPSTMIAISVNSTIIDPIISTMPPPLLAEAFSNGQIIALVAIVSGVILTAIIIVAGLKFAQRRHELWHETVRLALEKGQPLPPSPDEPTEQDRHEEERNDFRSGLILVAIGAGLGVFLTTIGAPQVRYVGAIPGFIGVALLLLSALNASSRRKDSENERPPQS